MMLIRWFDISKIFAVGNGCSSHTEYRSGNDGGAALYMGGK